MSSSIKLTNSSGKIVTITNPDTTSADVAVDLLNNAYTIATVDDFGTVPVGYTTVIVKDTDRGGVFNRIASTTANGGTVFAGSSGYWVRQYSGAVNVKWFGASPTSTAVVNTNAIQTALNLKLGKVFITNGTYKVNSITIDIAYSTLVGENSKTVLDFSESSFTNCVNIVGSIYPPYLQNGNGLFDIQFKGNGAAGAQTCLNIDNTAVGASSHINIERCNIYGFSVGIFYKNNAYLIRHISTDIFNCGTCLYSDGAGTDYGENWSYNGCAFYNSTNILDVTGYGHDLFFTACSFDYSTKIFKKISTASVFLSQCHIEYNHSIEDSLFSVVGNEGYLCIDKSVILSTSDGTSTARVGLCDNGHVEVTRTKIHNFARSCTLPYLTESINNGKIDVFRNSFLNIDNTSMGLSNINLFNNNYAYITGDTATITKRRTGTNIILSNGANSDELTVTKTYGGGSPASFNIYFPLNGATRYRIKISLVEATLFTGTSYWTFCSAKDFTMSDNYGLMDMSSIANQGTVAVSLPTLSINEYFSLENTSSSNYGFVSVNLNGVNGSGNTLKLKIQVYGI